MVWATFLEPPSTGHDILSTNKPPSVSDNAAMIQSCRDVKEIIYPTSAFRPSQPNMAMQFLASLRSSSPFSHMPPNPKVL